MRPNKPIRRLPCLSLPEPELVRQPSNSQTSPIQVAPNLFIGSYSSTFDLARLRAFGISSILNLAGEKYPQRHTSIDYVCLRMPDSPHIDIGAILTSALDFIESNISAGKSVLVHCVKGLSRAPTVACAYIMWKQSVDFHTALSMVKTSFPEADPNLGFVSQLECLMLDPSQGAYDHNSSRPEVDGKLRLSIQKL